jgi:hypothetical protein
MDIHNYFSNDRVPEGVLLLLINNLKAWDDFSINKEEDYVDSSEEED